MRERESEKERKREREKESERKIERERARMREKQRDRETKNNIPLIFGHSFQILLRTFECRRTPGVASCGEGLYPLLSR